MPTMSFRKAASIDGTTLTDKQIDVTGGYKQEIPGEAIAGSDTTPFTIAIDISAVKGFSVVSTVDCTLKTNDTGSPDDTIPLRANEPYQWHTNAYDAFLLTVDVTALYFVVAGATAGTVTLAAVVDPTP